MESKETEELFNKRAEELGPFIANLHKKGSSYDEIALHMNEIGIPTPIGKSTWDGPSVRDHHNRAIWLVGPVKT